MSTEKRNRQALVRLLPVEAIPPSLQDNTADLDRLKNNLLGRLQNRQPVTPLARMGKVAGRFRRAGFKGLAMVNDLGPVPELVDFFAQSPPCLAAMALDLGTTHLEASLIDLLDGKIIARAITENSQIEQGADILSRIHFSARAVPERGMAGDGLAILHERIIANVNELAVELADKARLQPNDIRGLTVAGNPGMTHFFLRLDPYYLCREPYIPVVNTVDPCHAADLGLVLHPAAPVMVLPSVGSYFGGDLIAGILASGLDLQEKTAMFIDVGTNAEVVIGNRDWLIACAGAAGPALEGGVARMGMRAVSGAIEHVTIDPASGELSYTTIDGGAARGICGSGIIDLVAGLYLARIIDIRGKFRPGQKQAGKRLQEMEDGLAFVLVEATESGNNKPVLLTQIDLNALMRSKAAMYSILTTLINQVEMGFDELDRIYVAGAFGRHIDPRQAVVLGMLPDLPLSVYEPVGNSSLAGAEMFLLDRQVRERCREVVKKVTYLELNVNQEFMMRFSGCRFIPHTDHRLFPSVPFFSET